MHGNPIGKMIILASFLRMQESGRTINEPFILQEFNEYALCWQHTFIVEQDSFMRRNDEIRMIVLIDVICVHTPGNFRLESNNCDGGFIFVYVYFT